MLCAIHVNETVLFYSMEYYFGITIMRGVLRSLAICMLCLYIHAVDQPEPAAPEMVIVPPEEATTRPSSCSDRPLLLNATDNFSKQQRIPDMDIVMEEPSQKAELIERVSPKDVVKEVLIPQANASYEKLSSGPPRNKIEEQSRRSVSEACWVDRWSISQVSIFYYAEIFFALRAMHAWGKTWLQSTALKEIYPSTIYRSNAGCKRWALEKA